MSSYLEKVATELSFWKLEVHKKPSFFDNAAVKMQAKLNSYIPKKVHAAITTGIKHMVNTVRLGAQITATTMPPVEISLLHREALVKAKIDSYCKTGAAEGGITGAGGFLMSVADFPILLSIKIKLLYDIAAIYGFDTRKESERLFLLHIFQLAFSSKLGSQKTFRKMEGWNECNDNANQMVEIFDWQTFQQEYRDYIDLAKLAQMIPVVGAAVGAVANYQLIKKLGETAMMSYRMRLLG